MTLYDLGLVIGAKGDQGDPGEKGETGPQGPKGDPAQLPNTVTSTDTTHATTGKAVYDFVTTLIGDIEEDMME